MAAAAWANALPPEAALQQAITMLASRSAFLVLTHVSHIVPHLLQRCSRGGILAMHYVNFLGRQLLHAGAATSSNMEGFSVKIEAAPGVALCSGLLKLSAHSLSAGTTRWSPTQHIATRHSLMCALAAK